MLLEERVLFVLFSSFLAPADVSYMSCTPLEQCLSWLLDLNPIVAVFRRKPDTQLSTAT